jgi:hypothetical protein
MTPGEMRHCFPGYAEKERSLVRCPDYSKMVSFDELRIDEVEVSIECGVVWMSGTVYRPCAECGIDLKSAEVDGAANANDAFNEDGLPKGYTVEYEISGDADISSTESVETKDRYGKSVRNPRRLKMSYGVVASVPIKRIVKNAEGKELKEHEDRAVVELSWASPASGFDEC